MFQLSKRENFMKYLLLLSIFIFSLNSYSETPEIEAKKSDFKGVQIEFIDSKGSPLNAAVGLKVHRKLDAKTFYLALCDLQWDGPGSFPCVIHDLWDNNSIRVDSESKVVFGPYRFIRHHYHNSRLRNFRLVFKKRMEISVQSDWKRCPRGSFPGWEDENRYYNLELENYMVDTESGSGCGDIKLKGKELQKLQKLVCQFDMSNEELVEELPIMIAKKCSVDRCQYYDYPCTEKK